MPYNGAGTYSPPAADFPAVSGTLIQALKFNNTINDIATGLSTAITKDGQTVVTANIPFAGFYATNVGIRAIDGVVGTPGIAFNQEASLGFYRIGANNLGLSVAGSKKWDITVAGSKFYHTLTVEATNPELHLNGTAVGTSQTRRTTNNVLRWLEGVPSGSTDYRWNNGSSDVLTISAAGTASLGSTVKADIANSSQITLDATTSTFVRQYVGGVETGRITSTTSSYSFTAIGALPISFFAGTGGGEQVRILGTAAVTRYLTFSGANGGNPTIDVSAGSLAITPAVVMASTLSAAGMISSTANIGFRSTVAKATQQEYFTGFNGTDGQDWSIFRAAGVRDLQFYSTVAGTVLTLAQAGGATFTGSVVAGGIIQTTAGAGGTSMVIPATGRFYLDGGGDTYIYEQGANRIDLVAGAVVTQSITATGVSINQALTYGGVTLSNAVTGTGKMVLDTSPSISDIVLTGGQIAFPATQNPSANANTLDDYEEGAWTPNVGGSATYTVQTGHYTKVGRLVEFDCELIINVIGTGSLTTISGLPFASANVNSSGGACVTSFGSLSSNVVFITGDVPAASSAVLLRSIAAAGASIALNNVITSGTSIKLAGHYYV